MTRSVIRADSYLRRSKSTWIYHGYRIQLSGMWGSDSSSGCCGRGKRLVPNLSNQAACSTDCTTTRFATTTGPAESSSCRSRASNTGDCPNLACRRAGIARTIFANDAGDRLASRNRISLCRFSRTTTVVSKTTSTNCWAVDCACQLVSFCTNTSPIERKEVWIMVSRALRSWARGGNGVAVSATAAQCKW